jgi:hypothetical protein
VAAPLRLLHAWHATSAGSLAAPPGAAAAAGTADRRRRICDRRRRHRRRIRITVACMYYPGAIHALG